MGMQVIFVIDINQMDKTTGQYKSDKLPGVLEVSYEIITANMQSFILNIIHNGSQIMHICNYWISNTQWWHINLKWYL